MKGVLIWKMALHLIDLTEETAEDTENRMSKCLLIAEDRHDGLYFRRCLSLNIN